jgi:hypothetical protein
MNKRTWYKTTGILIVLFIIIIVGGRYSISRHSSITIGTSTPALVEKESTTPSEVAAEPAPQAENTQVSQESQCVKDLEKKIKDEQTSYVKGSILVTFKEGTTFEEALGIVRAYGGISQDSGDARSSYEQLRLVTVQVPKGEEVHTICAIKTEGRVQYSGLNETFSIHQ